MLQVQLHVPTAHDMLLPMLAQLDEAPLYPDAADFSPLRAWCEALLLLGQALHAADISNPTKERGTMLRWTERVMKEFWMQGDKEASLGLPISAFMDRTQAQVVQCQMGFINVLCKPLYVEWHKLLGEVVKPGIECIEQSLKIWEIEGSAPAAGWESEEFVR